jgi:putative membrane protein
VKPLREHKEHTPMMWGYLYPGMGWWMIVSSLIWLALIGAAVWALVRWVAHQTGTGTSGQPGGRADGASAMEILRQRFARGEIDGDTFEQMRRQLEASGVDRGAPTATG